MQEDALNLFQAGLREYMGSHNAKSQGSQNIGWGVTGLSISASKIVSIPSVSVKLLFQCFGNDWFSGSFGYLFIL